MTDTVSPASQAEEERKKREREAEQARLANNGNSAGGNNAADETLSPEERKQRADEARSQLNHIVNGNSALRGIVSFFGLNGGDPKTAQSQNSFTNLVNNSMAFSAADLQVHPGLRDMRLDEVGPLENNLRIFLQDAFDKKRFVFDGNTSNQEAFSKLMEQVPDIARQGMPKPGIFDGYAMITALTEATKKLGGELKPEPKLTVASKITNDSVSYGQKLDVDGRSPASVAAIGLVKPEFKAYDFDGHAFTETKDVNMDEVRHTLGDKLAVQTVNIKQNDPIDGGIAKPSLDGYFLSNGNGKGIYIMVDDISREDTKIDLSLKPEVTQVAATPAPSAAPSAPQQQPLAPGA